MAKKTLKDIRHLSLGKTRIQFTVTKCYQKLMSLKLLLEKV